MPEPTASEVKVAFEPLAGLKKNLSPAAEANRSLVFVNSGNHWDQLPYLHEQLLLSAYVANMEKQLQKSPLTGEELENYINLFDWISTLRPRQVQQDLINKRPDYSVRHDCTRTNLEAPLLTDNYRDNFQMQAEKLKKESVLEDKDPRSILTAILRGHVNQLIRKAVLNPFNASKMDVTIGRNLNSSPGT